MKRILYLILKSSPIAFKTLEALKEEGYNMTIISSESLRHAIDDFPEEHHFYTLRNFEQRELLESLFCMFVGDEDKVNSIKNSIRRLTNNFNDIRGFMFSKKTEDYEGSI